MLGWHVGIASTAYLTATQTQALLALNYPEYIFEKWHGTLLVALVIFAGFFNTVLARHFPLIEGMMLIPHTASLLCTFVPLWMLSPLTTLMMCSLNSWTAAEGATVLHARWAYLPPSCPPIVRPV